MFWCCLGQPRLRIAVCSVAREDGLVLPMEHGYNVSGAGSKTHYESFHQLH